MVTNPPIISAMAPVRVVRFQEREQRTTGVKAQASPVQAKRTNQKTIRTSARAMKMAPTPMTTVVSFP